MLFGGRRCSHASIAGKYFQRNRERSQYKAPAFGRPQPLGIARSASAKFHPYRRGSPRSIASRQGLGRIYRCSDSAPVGGRDHLVFLLWGSYAIRKGHTSTANAILYSHLPTPRPCRPTADSSATTISHEPTPIFRPTASHPLTGDDTTSALHSHHNGGDNRIGT